MKNLIIIGAGGCGREVLQWALDANKREPIWNIKGFLDDNPHALDGKSCAAKIIGTVDGYPLYYPDDEFVCAIGSPAVKRRVVELLKARGAAFANVIHPTAVVSDSAWLGEGVILYPFAIVSPDAAVGDCCIINMHSAVAHDASLDDYCTISAFCDITGNCTLGKGVFMGTGAKLTPGVSVGEKAFICAGSIVFNNVKPETKVLGNPARRLKI